MDWAAKMFGLHGVFWNVNEVGGGVIQVRFYRPFPRAHSLDLFPYLSRRLLLIRLSLPSSLPEPDTSVTTRAQR